MAALKLELEFELKLKLRNPTLQIPQDQWLAMTRPAQRLTSPRPICHWLVPVLVLVGVPALEAFHLLTVECVKKGKPGRNRRV